MSKHPGYTGQPRLRSVSREQRPPPNVALQPLQKGSEAYPHPSVRQFSVGRPLSPVFVSSTDTSLSQSTVATTMVTWPLSLSDPSIFVSPAQAASRGRNKDVVSRVYEGVLVRIVLYTKGQFCTKIRIYEDDGQRAPIRDLDRRLNVRN